MKIIKFQAVWCSACLVMKKKWKEIKELYPDLDVTEYDYDLDEDEVIKYNVDDKLPVIIMLDDNGKELKRLVGEKNKEEVLSFIKER